ncbi:MAG: tetratricopeptide repeat protein [Candidatus Scalindua sediminis]
MRKLLIFQILLILFLLTSFAATSYGQSKFSQYYNKGIEYYKQGKYDQAGEQFKKALELKPNHVYALYGLGNTHYCKAKYDEAVKIYTNAIKINPDYPKVHYSLSLAYSKLGMTRDAEKEKEIFRKLTQGEKSVVKTPTRKRSKVVREVKKDRFVETKKKSMPQKKVIERKPKETKVQEEIVRELKKKKPVERKSVKEDESQTIFKGYTKETKKVKPRVYVKKYKKAFETKLKPLSYIKEKWSKSGINKILICTFGYIFATQMWLCVVAFFGLIIWRIRKKAD